MVNLRMKVGTYERLRAVGVCRETLPDLVLVHEQVCGFKVPMYDVVLVQVVHALHDVQRHSHDHWQLQERLVFVEKVVHASTGHEFYRYPDHSSVPISGTKKTEALKKSSAIVKANIFQERSKSISTSKESLVWQK